MSSGFTKTIRRGSESKRKRSTEENVGSRFKEWTGMDFASSTRQAKKRIVLKSSVVPNDLARLWDRLEWNRTILHLYLLFPFYERLRL